MSRQESKNWPWVAVPVALALLLWLYPYMADGSPPAPSFPRASLSVKLADGHTIPFDIEVATTPAQTSYGLMFRRALPGNAGMLFLFDPPRMIYMWMKNTYIPLDMLFVRKDGTIARIAAEARPFDLASISSGEPVKGVIEIGGGVAAKDGIKAGDRVLYPAFASGP